MKTPPAGVPPPPVRGDGLFVRLDAVFARFDGFMARWLPPAANPLAQSGRSANLALLVAVVSGVALLIWYSPSIQFAYSSLDEIRGRTLGGWVRALHRYSSDLVMLLLLVHAVRMFAARKFAGPRWLAWVTGVMMLGLVWFIGWTGYWLVWDQPAQQVAVMSTHLLDSLRIFGDPMGRLFLADRLVPSLLFFVVFFVHMLLPLGIAVGLAVHLARINRAHLLPSRGLSLALIGGMALAAWLLPAPLDEPAQMAVKPERLTADAWYLAPLALGLRFQHGGLWLALTAATGAAVAVPWLLGRRRLPSYSAQVEEGRCHACTQCMQDCPFDAIVMAPRTDGKPFPSHAWVDPSRCVECGVCGGSCDSEGISLPWFDTRAEESRIESETLGVTGACDKPWLALVAGDIDGGLGRFEIERWSRRLPGYRVQAVPTASWVRPKFVERLLRGGVQGVLIVRDARTEGWARDGGRWVFERLEGIRKPVFRPERAGSDAWRVVDFDPSDPAGLKRDAENFRAVAKPIAIAKTRRRGRVVFAGTLLAAVLGVAAIGPSHLRVDNPAAPDPELVLSLRALGDWLEAPLTESADDTNRLVHMRGRTVERPRRGPVAVRLTVDGVAEERHYAARGLFDDGPALGEWRRLLAPGPVRIQIEIRPGPESEPLYWEKEFVAEERRYHVVTYDVSDGFRMEE